SAAPTASAEPEPAPSATAEPAPAPAPSASAAPAPAPHTEPEAAEVRLGEALAFTLRVKHGEQTPAQRAAAASKALKDAFEGSTPEDVHVEKKGDVVVVYLGKAPIVQLTDADATAAGDGSLEVHADSVAASVKKAVQAEKQRTALASRIFAICLVVFFAVVVFYLWRKIGDLAERANDWLEDNPHRVPELRLSTFTILNPAAFRSGLALAISIGKWLSQLTLVYLWLVAGLSFFESTRPYTDRINAIILQPFLALASRVAGSLPITVVVAIAVLVVAIVMRVVGLFFESVREGTTELEWLTPELARPTSILIRAGLILVTLIFAAPVLTGHPEGALATAGLVGLGTIGLASVPLVGCGVVGLVVVYGRRMRAGDFVRIGEQAGRVTDVGLLDVTLEDDSGYEIRVPHLLALVRPVTILGPTPRVEVEISVPRSVAATELREKLLLAISPAGVDPRVEIDRIAGDSVSLKLSVASEDPDAKSQLHLLALKAFEVSRLRDSELPG
ncbi:MAG: mechanosensitive ion channel family protein, partial [Polyangiaceae bacterium]|nr:mechanosensitive ion channel family protein [Polyangiaceae bacterium]